MKNNSRVYYTGKILFYLFLVLILGNLFYNCSNEDGESVPTIQESLEMEEKKNILKCIS